MQTACSSSDMLFNRPLGRGPALKHLFARISEISHLSIGAQQILKLSRDPDSLERLQEVLQVDPSTVAQVLRRVNSPYYQLDAEVHDLTVATRLLGYRECRNIAFMVHLSRMFTPAVTFGTFSMSGLWSHSVAVAAVSQMIARVSGCAAPAEAFLAGLLHDIGLLLCCRQLRRRFLQVVEQLPHHSSTTALERSVYSFDHAQLGAHVARGWELADPLADAIGHHHDLQEYHGPHQALVYIVATANYLCSRAGCTSLGIHNVPLPPDDVYRILGMDQLALAVIWQELPATLDKATTLAEM